MARRALRTHALILHTVCLADLGDLLPNMHMGPHPRRDVTHVCDVWSRALPPNLASWGGGVCGELTSPNSSLALRIT